MLLSYSIIIKNFFFLISFFFPIFFLSDGIRYYLHGTTWHPVMGPFGPMDCVNCVCKSGRIECHRLECSDRRSLNCDKPVKVTGSCCPVCPLQGDNQGKEQFKPILSKYDPNPDPDLIFQSFFFND